MTDSQFYNCWGAALTDTDKDTYISDYALSSMWDDDPTSPIPGDRIALLSNIWDVAHMSVGQIRATQRMTQVDFATLLCVSKRTLERWESSRGCPDYIRLMIARQFGLL